MKLDLVPMVDFVLWIRSLTTIEFCEKFNFPVPSWTGDKGLMVCDMLRLDAIKFRIIGEYAKILRCNVTGKTEDLGTLLHLESINNTNKTRGFRNDIPIGMFGLCELREKNGVIVAIGSKEVISVKTIEDLCVFGGCVEINI